MTERRLPPALEEKVRDPGHDWASVPLPDLLNWLYGKKRDFCAFCGAGIPPITGEGTCHKCDSGIRTRTPGLVERVSDRCDETIDGEDVLDALRAELGETE